MAKLYFRYGTMSSAKTLNLLAVAHNYRQQGRTVLVAKPRLDSRFGDSVIRSRAGLETRADLLLEPGTPIPRERLDGVSCILVDEAQFLSVGQVEELREIVSEFSVPVICYGLRTNFQGELFTGSRRLFELADSIEEIKTTCSRCTRKSTMNLRHADGVPTVEGPGIVLGAEDKYFPVCYSCYRTELSKAGFTLNEGTWTRAFSSAA